MGFLGEFKKKFFGGNNLASNLIQNNYEGEVDWGHKYIDFKGLPKNLSSACNIGSNGKKTNCISRFDENQIIIAREDLVTIYKVLDSDDELIKVMFVFKIANIAEIIYMKDKTCILRAGGNNRQNNYVISEICGQYLITQKFESDVIFDFYRINDTELMWSNKRCNSYKLIKEVDGIFDFYNVEKLNFKNHSDFYVSENYILGISSDGIAFYEKESKKEVKLESSLTVLGRCYISRDDIHWKRSSIFSLKDDIFVIALFRRESVNTTSFIIEEIIMLQMRNGILYKKSLGKDMNLTRIKKISENSFVYNNAYRSGTLMVTIE